MKSLWRYLLDRLVYRIKPRQAFAVSPSDVFGYGPVNHWYKVDPWELARALVKAGCTATTIELLGWAGTDRCADPYSLRGAYKALLEAMRHYRLVTMVSIANDNKGSRKYGDDGKSLAVYAGQLDAALRLVLDGGPKGVIVQPVGETQTSAGLSFESAALGQLHAKGFRCCWNRGSRPRAAQAGCAYFAYHPATMADIGAAGGLTVTDHSILLKQLQSGNLYGLGNPESVRSYARTVRQGQRGFLYYGFFHERIDLKSIDAIGEAKK